MFREHEEVANAVDETFAAMSSPSGTGSCRSPGFAYSSWDVLLATRTRTGRVGGTGGIRRRGLQRRSVMTGHAYGWSATIMISVSSVVENLEKVVEKPLHILAGAVHLDLFVTAVHVVIACIGTGARASEQGHCS